MYLPRVKAKGPRWMSDVRDDKDWQKLKDASRKRYESRMETRRRQPVGDAGGASTRHRREKKERHRRAIKNGRREQRKSERRVVREDAGRVASELESPNLNYDS